MTTYGNGNVCDNPRNQDEIGEKELLVVSFGTSFNDSRVLDIKGTEDYLALKFPEWSVRRSFTSQVIINHIYSRDGEKIDNVRQALERAVSCKVRDLAVLPTHLMKGHEYCKMYRLVSDFADRFRSAAIAEPLLGDTGTKEDDLNEEKRLAAIAVTEDVLKMAGYDSLKSASDDKTAVVLFGHGTSHEAKITYAQMKTQIRELGYDNVFMGTVEGEPDHTGCRDVIEDAARAGFRKVILRPFMVVAGEHANNDMAGDGGGSWINQFRSSGYFDSVTAQIAGLGRIEAIRDIYRSHAELAIEKISC